MLRTAVVSPRFTALVIGILLPLLTSCQKGEPDRKKTDAGKIQSVTLVVPAGTTNVPLYTRAELLIQFSSSSTTAPYDPDPARGGMDLTATFTGPGGTLTVPGYYDGTNWRVRFAPTAAGKWTYTVTYRDPDSTGTWSEGTLTGVASAFPGFARIDGRYLRMTNGTIFFPVGHNNGWLPNVELPSFTEMAARGENLLAFWHATPWDTGGARAPIENVTGGVGNYNQSACAHLDGLVERAESAGVYLQPTIWSHGELRQQPHKWTTGEGWWDNNGYSAICPLPEDFFLMSTGGLETEQWRLQKNLLRYLFARYGYSRAILNWIVIAEVDGTNCFYSFTGTDWVEDAALVARLTAWLQAVRDFWSDMDFYRRNAAGRCPLAAFATDFEGVTMSGGLPPTFTAAYDADMGLRSTDTYTRYSSNASMAMYGGGETAALYQASAQPCFHGEIGGNNTEPLPIPQPQVAHDGLWSCVSAGACMTPMQWCDGGSWVLLTQPDGAFIRNQLQCLRTFMNGIGYLGDPTIDSGAVTVPIPLFAVSWSTHTNTEGFAWVRTLTPNFTAFGCQIQGLDNGTYSVQWYNVFTGSSPVAFGLPDTGTCTGNTLTITYPTTSVSGLTSLACKFSRTGAAASAPPSVSSTTSGPHVVASFTEEDLSPSGSEEDEDPPADPYEPVPPPSEF